MTATTLLDGDTLTTDSVITVTHLTKRYRDVTAVDDVAFSIERNSICGLLGRNGAGKSTLMHLITGQAIATAGEIRIDGQDPFENQNVLSRVCFIKESQKYPDDLRVKHVLTIAEWFLENWQPDVAAKLVKDFRLPMNRSMKKLSRGQLSAVAITVGIASRAPISFFDEPYLGLDAVARQMFYDALLADYAEHPRTIVISTHLIDEIADLLDHVLVIDNGRILIDSPAEDLRGSAVAISGARGVVDRITDGRVITNRRDVGGLSTVTIDGRITPQERADAEAAGLEVSPVSLQQLVVNATLGGSGEDSR